MFGRDKDKSKDEGNTTLGDVFINKAINHVMNSMNHGPDDAQVRHKIATSMKRAINMSKQAGGDITEPQKTILYRFATLLDGCKSFEELESKCIKAFKNRTDCKADRLLFKFDYDWKVPFTIPAFAVIPKLPRKGSREWLALEAQKDLESNPASEETPAESKVEPETLEQQETKAVEILAVAVMRIEGLERKNGILEREIENIKKAQIISVNTTPQNSAIKELTTKLRNHEHRDGKVVVITEV